MATTMTPYDIFMSLTKAERQQLKKQLKMDSNCPPHDYKKSETFPGGLFGLIPPKTKLFCRKCGRTKII